MQLRNASLPISSYVRLLPLLGCLALPLAGCSSAVDRAVAISPIPADYRARHTVALANAPRQLSIFFVGPSNRLDIVQERQIEGFARDYHATGQGPIQIAVPQGPVDQYAAEKTLGAVRRSLLRFGVRGRISIVAYPISDPSVASTLHLSFVTLQDRPTTRCGDWPDDLGSGTTVHTWENRTYYNFGCANQQTLAAQVADPRDLVKPRAEDPTDVQLRTRAIGLLRGTPGATAGRDPGTGWSF